MAPNSERFSGSGVSDEEEDMVEMEKDRDEDDDRFGLFAFEFTNPVASFGEVVSGEATEENLKSFDELEDGLLGFGDGK